MPADVGDNDNEVIAMSLTIDFVQLALFIAILAIIFYGRKAADWCSQNLYIGRKGWWRDNDGVWHRVGE